MVETTFVTASQKHLTFLRKLTLWKAGPSHPPESTRNIISPKSEQQKIGLPKKINKVNIRRGEKGTE